MKRSTKKRKNGSFNGSSKEGMQTSVWGPILWTFLHIMSFNYPVNPTEADKVHYKGFVDHLQYILPCKTCRENLPKNMKRAGYDDECFQNRETLSRFFWRLHNEVSRAINKDPKKTSTKIIENSYEEIAEKFELIRASCSSPSSPLPSFTGEKVSKKSHLGCTSALHGVKRICKISITEKKGVCKGSSSLHIPEKKQGKNK